MSKAIGEVTRIDGEFIVKAGDGTLKILAPGTLLYEDDVIQGRGGSRELEIELVNGDTLIVGGDETVTLSESVITKEPFTPEETNVDIEPIIAKVNSGEWVMSVDPEVINGSIIPEHFVARTSLVEEEGGNIPERPVSTEESSEINPLNTIAADNGTGAEAVVSDVPETQIVEADQSNPYVQDNQPDYAETPNLSRMSIDAVREITELQSVIDTEATEAAGIYERDGNYYKTETQSVATNTVDVAALRDMGYTLGTDGNIYTINSNGAKVQIEQEATRTITKVVAVDPIMKTASEATTVMVAGDEFEKNPGMILKNTTQTIDLGVSTKNIEIDFNAFNQGSLKIDFLSNGQIIHSVSQNNVGNHSVGYGFGQEFDSIQVTANGKDLQIESIKGRGAAHEVTVEAGGEIPDTEAMAAAGITWVDTVSQTIIQTPTDTGSETNDLQNIGNVGNNNVKGFNPEDREVSQVFDFGSELAFQKVSITVDLTVVGSWDYNNSSTKDILTVSANGEPLQTYNYTSSDTDYNNAIARGESVQKVGAKTYTYDVFLDENGQVQLEFMVASTAATDEVVNVNAITAKYEAHTGYVQSVQETETYMETVFVDAPGTLVDPANISGGIPMVMQEVSVEVEAEPIMTTQEVVVGYEYDISYETSLSDTDGSETLSALTLDNLPDDVELQMGGETVVPNEDGSYTLDTESGPTVSMTLVTSDPITSEQFENVSASVTSSDNDDASTATITVTGNEESISFSGLSDMVNNANDQTENPLSEEIALGQIFTLDQDPNVALFEEDLTSGTSTSTQNTPSTSVGSELDGFADIPDAGLVVEVPVEIAAT